jgi:hypothetical protein
MNLSSSSIRVTEDEFERLYAIALLGAPAVLSVDAKFDGNLSAQFDGYVQQLLGDKLFAGGECTKPDATHWSCVDADGLFAWWAMVESTSSRGYWERVVTK